MRPSPAWRAAAAAWPFCAGVAVLHDLVEQLAGAVLVAHFPRRPWRGRAWWRPPATSDRPPPRRRGLGRRAEVEADRRQVGRGAAALGSDFAPGMSSSLRSKSRPPSETACGRGRRRAAGASVCRAPGRSPGPTRSSLSAGAPMIERPSGVKSVGGVAGRRPPPRSKSTLPAAAGRPASARRAKCRGDADAWPAPPPRSKSQRPAAAAAAAARSGRRTRRRRRTGRSADRSSGRARRPCPIPGPAPLVRLFSLSAFCSKACVSLRLRVDLRAA